MSDAKKTFGQAFIDGFVGPANAAARHIDQRRNVFIGGSVTGSNINLGDIRNSTNKSIAALPASPGTDTARLRSLLEELTELLTRAPESGVAPPTAAEAMHEVKSLADAAAQAATKPADNGLLATVKKTLRTLKGFADEFAAFPAIADKYRTLVDQIAAFFTAA